MIVPSFGTSTFERLTVKCECFMYPQKPFNFNVWNIFFTSAFPSRQWYSKSPAICLDIFSCTFSRFRFRPQRGGTAENVALRFSRIKKNCLGCLTYLLDNSEEKYSTDVDCCYLRNTGVFCFSSFSEPCKSSVSSQCPVGPATCLVYLVQPACSVDPATCLVQPAWPACPVVDSAACPVHQTWPICPSCLFSKPSWPCCTPGRPCLISMPSGPADCLVHPAWPARPVGPAT
jgi:hypothetical protein